MENCPVLPQPKCFSKPCCSCEFYLDMINDPEYQERLQRFLKLAKYNLAIHAEKLIPDKPCEN